MQAMACDLMPRCLKKITILCLLLLMLSLQLFDISINHALTSLAPLVQLVQEAVKEEMNEQG
jgi:hypothetical protein